METKLKKKNYVIKSAKKSLALKNKNVNFFS